MYQEKYAQNKSITCQDGSIFNTLYLMAFGTIQTTCKMSCKKMEFQSSLFEESQALAESGVVIIFDSEVEEWDAKFTFTANTVVETLGSALGLWLGLGVIQLAEKMEYIVTRIKTMSKFIKSNNDIKNLASTSDEDNIIT